MYIVITLLHTQTQGNSGNLYSGRHTAAELLLSFVGFETSSHSVALAGMGLTVKTRLASTWP